MEQGGGADGATEHVAFCRHTPRRGARVIADSDSDSSSSSSGEEAPEALSHAGWSPHHHQQLEHAPHHAVQDLARPLQTPAAGSRIAHGEEQQQERLQVVFRRQTPRKPGGVIVDTDSSSSDGRGSVSRLRGDEGEGQDEHSSGDDLPDQSAYTRVIKGTDSSCGCSGAETGISHAGWHPRQQQQQQQPPPVFTQVRPPATFTAVNRLPHVEEQQEEWRAVAFRRQTPKKPARVIVDTDSSDGQGSDVSHLPEGDEFEDEGESEHSSAHDLCDKIARASDMTQHTQHRNSAHREEKVKKNSCRSSNEHRDVLDDTYSTHSSCDAHSRSILCLSSTDSDATSYASCNEWINDWDEKTDTQASAACDVAHPGEGGGATKGPSPPEVLCLLTDSSESDHAHCLPMPKIQADKGATILDSTSNKSCCPNPYEFESPSDSIRGPDSSFCTPFSTPVPVHLVDHRTQSDEPFILNVTSLTSEGGRISRTKRASVKTSRKSSCLAFKRNRSAHAKNLYQEWNELVFNNGLPKDLPIRWNPRLLTTAGQVVNRRSSSQRDACTSERIPSAIELSPKVVDTTERLRNTLAHEMCHVAAEVISKQFFPPHGPAFKTWALCIRDMVPDLDVITTCHTYEIYKPFKWQCTNDKCRTVYSRHKKTIDPNTHKCGSCNTKIGYLGKFDRDGQIIAQQKKNSYSQYVKDNFALVKTSCPPGTPLGMIMKSIATQWNLKKTQQTNSVKAVSMDDTNSRESANLVVSLVDKFNTIDLTG